MKAIPLWEISRIVLSLDGTDMVLFGPPRNFDRFTQGTVDCGQTDLTYEEAERLICELRTALDYCKEMDQLVEQLEPKE